MCLLSCNLDEFYRAFIIFISIPQIVHTFNDKIAIKSTQSWLVSSDKTILCFNDIAQCHESIFLPPLFPYQKKQLIYLTR